MVWIRKQKIICLTRILTKNVTLIHLPNSLRISLRILGDGKAKRFEETKIKKMGPLKEH